jgi:hypothetical protein
VRCDACAAELNVCMAYSIDGGARVLWVGKRCAHRAHTAHVNCWIKATQAQHARCANIAIQSRSAA